MALIRSDLQKLLTGVDNADEIINKIMAEHGKEVNALKAENQELNTKVLDLTKDVQTKEKEFNDYKESVKDYETIKNQNQDYATEINNYKKAESNKVYIEELGKNGVDEKFKKFVFSELAPNENEKAEDYAKRVNEYVEKNPQYKAENYKNVSSSYKPNGGGAPDFEKMTAEEYRRYMNDLNKK